MRKYFVAYRFSGEKPEVLAERLSLVVESLNNAGIDAYCNLFDGHEKDAKNLNSKQMMDKAFKQIDERDGLFVLVASNDKSEGQLIEVGYSLAKGKDIIAAVHRDAGTNIGELARHSITWESLSDLKKKLEDTAI